MRKLIIRCATIIGLSLLFASSLQAASAVTFYHHDALGSIIATSDQDGFMSLNEEYQPYGEKIYSTEDPVSDNEDWYTGKNYSKELDLTYFGARWYDAKQGRFLSMDPAGVSLSSIHSFNRYHYGNNNPYKYIDPDGNAPTSVESDSDGDGIPNAVDDSGPGAAIQKIGDWGTGLVSNPDNRSGGGFSATKKPPIIIGENMKRVKEYADKTGGHAYRSRKNDPFDFNLGMKRNERWIQDQRTQGRNIIDIGPDFQRRAATGRSSPFYEMERQSLKGYGNRQQVFERSGSSGGIPGLDF